MGVLEGKIVVITGASSGFGLEMARLFAGEGAKVVMNGKDAKRLQEAGREVFGEKILIAGDISKEADVRKLFSDAVKKFGRVDFAINNAGHGIFKRVEETTEADWDAVLDVNLKGVFLCSREAAGIMKMQKAGHIINISSTAGLAGYDDGGAYCASKFGVRGFSQALAEEMKKFDVKVSVICPGAADTHFFDKLNIDGKQGKIARAGWEGKRKNMMRPKDVAELVLFMLTRPQRVSIPEVMITHFYPVWEE
jgi:NADP-dependent 3-hydroxy acid dehydrogenase YdfG